jgi:hypothetical protein
MTSTAEITPEKAVENPQTPKPEAKQKKAFEENVAQAPAAAVKSAPTQSAPAQNGTAKIDTTSPEAIISSTEEAIDTLTSALNAKGGRDNPKVLGDVVKFAEDYATGMHYSDDIVLKNPGLGTKAKLFLDVQAHELSMHSPEGLQVATAINDLIQNSPELQTAQQQARVLLSQQGDGHAAVYNGVDFIAGASTAVTNLAQGVKTGLTAPVQLGWEIYKTYEQDKANVQHMALDMLTGQSPFIENEAGDKVLKHNLVLPQALPGMVEAGVQRYLNDVNDTAAYIAEGGETNIINYLRNKPENGTSETKDEITVQTKLHAAAATLAHYGMNIFGDILSPIDAAKNNEISAGKMWGLLTAEVADPVDMAVGARVVDTAAGLAEPSGRLTPEQSRHQVESQISDPDLFALMQEQTVDYLNDDGTLNQQALQQANNQLLQSELDALAKDPETTINVRAMAGVDSSSLEIPRGPFGGINLSKIANNVGNYSKTELGYIVVELAKEGKIKPSDIPYLQKIMLGTPFEKAYVPIMQKVYSDTASDLKPYVEQYNLREAWPSMPYDDKVAHLTRMHEIHANAMGVKPATIEFRPVEKGHISDSSDGKTMTQGVSEVFVQDAMILFHEGTHHGQIQTILDIQNRTKSGEDIDWSDPKTRQAKINTINHMTYFDTDLAGADYFLQPMEMEAVASIDILERIFPSENHKQFLAEIF